MTKLRISENLTLPLDFVTSTQVSEVADVLGVSAAAKFEQLKKSWGIK